MRSRNPRSSDEFGQDDPTVVDGTPLVEFETPETMPRCQECGRVVFFDDFTDAGPKATVKICVGAALSGKPCPGTLTVRLPQAS